MGGTRYAMERTGLGPQRIAPIRFALLMGLFTTSASNAYGQPVPYGGYGEQHESPWGYGVPDPVPERPAAPPPRGWKRERTFHTGLFASGATLFGFSYALAVVLARAEPEVLVDRSVRDRQPSIDHPLYAPLVGPLVALAQTERTAAQRALVACDALGQFAGIALVAAGLALRRDRLVPIEAASVDLTVSPGFLGLDGAF